MPFTLKREGIWSLVIISNLLILGFIGHRVIRAMETSTGTSTDALAWSDQVPELGAVVDSTGKEHLLDPVQDHLVLLFFDAAAAGPVESIFAGLTEVLPETAPVRRIGVFSGSDQDFTGLGIELSAPVVADPEGALRRKLGLAQDSTTHHSLVVDPDGTVGLVFQGILPAHLFVDYLWREALGRSDRPPRIEKAQSLPTTSLTELAAAPAAAQAAIDGLPSGLDLTSRTPVEQVSDFSVFRLRRAPDGRLYGLSRTESRIFQFGPDMESQVILGGFGQSPGRFMMPSDLDFNAEGHLVVLDSGNSRIQVLDTDGEALHVVALDADVVSLAALTAREVVLAMPGKGSAFAALDPTRARSAPQAIGSFAEIEWLRGRVENHFGPDVQEAAYAGLHAALNRAFIRKDAGGGFISVPIWEPVFRRLDEKGKVLSETKFSFSGIEEKTNLFEETLQQALEQRHLGILYLFQDLNLGADGRTIGLTVVGDCPGVLILDGSAQVTHELCLARGDGSLVAPVTLAPAGPRSWWIGNGTGIYRLELG